MKIDTNGNEITEVEYYGFSKDLKDFENEVGDLSEFFTKESVCSYIAQPYIDTEENRHRLGLVVGQDNQAKISAIRELALQYIHVDRRVAIVVTRLFDYLKTKLQVNAPNALYLEKMLSPMLNMSTALGTLLDAGQDDIAHYAAKSMVHSALAALLSALLPEIPSSGMIMNTLEGVIEGQDTADAIFNKRVIALRGLLA